MNDSKLTKYHVKYYAHELNRVGGNGVDRLGKALFDACVDLNPHQIEAAMFALRSPLSKGVLLADEVGLGKTIEAGLVLCQSWSENKRCIIVICPASLRKQWAVEMEEKFNLPSQILDSKTFKDIQKRGNPNPFHEKKIIICSMNFIASKSIEVTSIPWDLVVIDEAHKLRNAYRESNRIGQAVKLATLGRKKILLTATPLQNSLLELYGLSTIIDENIFGDLSSFRSQFINNGGDLSTLRDRLQSFCSRTLRSQVVEYVPYTKRNLITRPFKPTEQEHKLYVEISDYLMRDDTYAFPIRQKHLLIMLIRKVLSSSPIALIGTLNIIKDRLVKLYDNTKESANFTEILIAEDDIDSDLLDEILEDDDEYSEKQDIAPTDDLNTKKIIEIKKLKEEIKEIESYIHWAEDIGVDTKTKALLTALDIGFEQMLEMGAAEKAVIFTESRRSQDWLYTYLENNGYANKVVTFNGTNKSELNKTIYANWVNDNKDTGRITGSRQIDMRAAILDFFKNDAKILIATEAGAEGLNMQFCSLLVNYDLPWNPQRIEQRIGRCHRYGQKFDVVVINFLNEKNQADIRVYELLDQKFNLFSGVFGASDDVLGSIESGVDFERRVLEIYQECRSEKEIKSAFKKLQDELDQTIQARMTDTRKTLLENFDEDVHERLKVNLAGAKDKLDKIGKLFWDVTKYVLNKEADFNDINYSFNLHEPQKNNIRVGTYNLVTKNRDIQNNEFLYRLSHPLGENVLSIASKYSGDSKVVYFDITNNPTKISLVENLKGKSGWLILQKLEVLSFEVEEYLLFSGFDNFGKNLSQETCEKIFNCIGYEKDDITIPDDIIKRLKQDSECHIQSTIAKNLEENNKHLSEACIQLDKWAEDMEKAASKEMDDTKRQIAEIRRNVRLAENIQDQAELQNELKSLEKIRRTQQQKIFEVEDEISEKRDSLVLQLTKRMVQKTKIDDLFTIRWVVV
ncbi:DEAD/DEAH box helicase [Thiospirochaeta perfilievii]|uniref:DEAD/DEAH box helicase n=1 Tax=Thiospirochaeta perfilievii TaxID=252967 RepID=A0A5C1Q9I6_9SPIO|nr:SNF2-related protein [Thiospirochaeta perfilievii]QEN03304.1 DEAD/DEAH box helicase [Thiospirochaeta perfilievii]